MNTASPSPRQIVLLGATGSIGESTLQVIRQNPGVLPLLGIACHSRAAELASIAREFSVPYAHVVDPRARQKAREEKLFPPETTLLEDDDGLEQLASLPAAHTILLAIVGTAGLQPALAAIKAGKDLALASKEVLVMAGQFVQEALASSPSRLLPVDSEHNALFQCLENRSPSEIQRLILTASGGAFRDRPIASLENVTPAEAMQHPTWSMGPKITVDSATMANKGLEVIEAHWLFQLPPEKIEVVIHPQSILHGLVEWTDNSFLAQLSIPSMTFAIQHCLLYPERGGPAGTPLSWEKNLQLDLAPLDPQRYPNLTLAYQALSQGGPAPAIFNAANEIAVEAFLQEQCRFTEIHQIIDQTLNQVNLSPVSSLPELLDRDQAARKAARKLVPLR